MGRRNRRADCGYEPLDLTPADIPKPKPAKRFETISEGWERRDRNRQERSDRQQQARVDQGIDWSLCIVPGCGEELTGFLGRPRHENLNRRDSTLELPICFAHAAVVWKSLVAGHSKREEFITAIADVNDRLAARLNREHAHDKREFLARENGDIYFIRLNDLIKVGWTRDLHQRVRSYGASAVLLANYPATRDDETNLHRQLTPARAKGREWYDDGPIVQSFIDQALAKFGQPDLELSWTTPKRVVAGKHHR